MDPTSDVMRLVTTPWEFRIRYENDQGENLGAWHTSLTLLGAGAVVRLPVGTTRISVAPSLNPNAGGQG
jgi:hypothetical protein